MKILNADKHKYIPQQMLIEKIKYGNGVIKGGAFYLPVYKGEGEVDFKKIINSIAGIVGPIADAVSGGAKVVKSITGSGARAGIEADGLNAILQTETKTGSGFYFNKKEKLNKYLLKNMNLVPFHLAFTSPGAGDPRTPGAKMIKLKPYYDGTEPCILCKKDSVIGIEYDLKQI